MMLSESIVEKYTLSEADLKQAQLFQQKYGGRLDQIFLNLGALSDDSIVDFIADLSGCSVLAIDVSEFSAPSAVLSVAETFLALDHVPIDLQDDLLVVACKYPFDIRAIEVASRFGYRIAFRVASFQVLEELKTKFGLGPLEVDGDDSADYFAEERLRELATEAPTVNLLNSLITRGLKMGASDLHLEPVGTKFRARYRIDGVMHESETMPMRMQLPLVTRVKILAGMDISEKRRPQDGKIEIRIANTDLDIRVSALPLMSGESVVMRFLRKESIRIDVSTIGMSLDIEAKLLADIRRTSGVILMTGPTGSGKTTTLYTLMNVINSPSMKIVTLEDPVEYQLEGINQVQINADIGFGFAEGLRSIVRQDPDVIMLGEIRDKVSAEIALQSALTGHLVLSTVHTNDAASAFTRLLDLGVEEYLLNAAIIAVVAQRLARKLCEHCKTSHAHPLETASELGMLERLTELAGASPVSLWEAQGCDQCGHTGYKGRVALTEYLPCDHVIRSIAKDSEFVGRAQQHNRELGHRTLIEDGLLKVLQGTTTVEEVLRVAG